MSVEIGSTASDRPSPGFWRRQFGGDPTAHQTGFDLFAGILLPGLCVVLDPIVLRGAPGFGLLTAWAIPVYCFMGVSALCLLVWLVFRKPSAFLAGCMFVAAAFSLVLGIVLLPFSLIGLMMAIGVLGFSPFLACIVYARNGARALAASRSRSFGKSLTPSAYLTLSLGVFVAATPFLGHLYVLREVSTAMDQLASGQKTVSVDALARIRKFSYAVPGYDELVWAYHEEKDDRRRARLSSAYTELTGGSIEDRLARLLD